MWLIILEIALWFMSEYSKLIFNSFSKLMARDGKKSSVFVQPLRTFEIVPLFLSNQIARWVNVWLTELNWNFGIIIINESPIKLK